MSEAELVLQPFRRFTFVTAHSPTLPSLYLRHSLLILQAIRRFTYVRAHSPTHPSIYLRHSLLILQLYCRFSYVTGSSLTSPGGSPMFRTCLVRRYFNKTLTATFSGYLLYRVTQKLLSLQTFLYEICVNREQLIKL